VVVTGYLGDVIERALGSGERFGVQLAYCRQTQANGTAHALLLAEPLVGPEPCLVSWGDILVPRSFYREFVDTFARTPCDAQLAVNEIDDPWRGAAVYVEDGWRVVRLEEKPPRGTSTTRWNNAGIHLLTPLAFGYARNVAASPRGEYELPQALAQMVHDCCPVRAVPVRGPWSDVGTPEDLAAANQLFAAPGAA